MKICRTCNITKSLDEYGKLSASKDGLCPQCKTCKNAYHTKYSREWNAANKEAVARKAKRWRTTHKEQHDNYCKEYALRNREKRLASRRLWRKRNAKRINADKRFLYKHDFQYRTIACLRSLIHCFRRRKGVRKLICYDELGCTFQEFQLHIADYLYVMGLTESDYGKYGWHYEHCVPVSSFDLSTRESQLAANHFTNIMPLWWEDNLAKNDNPNYWKSHEITIFKPVVYGDHFIGFDEFDGLE